MDLRREDLDAAVTAGIIDSATRERLLLFAASQAQGAAGPDHESFRLLSGFNDIFVSLACILLLIAVASLAPLPLRGAFVAAAAWGLAEYFTRKRRMALPSIILLLAFVGGLFFAVAGLSGGLTGAVAAASIGAFPLAFAAGGAAAVVGATLHWLRFRVPITLAAGALGLAIAAGGLMAQFSSNMTVLLLTMFASGLGIFALAMRYDMTDRVRLTRSTDIAFWLHLLAAPLIVHPIFALSGLTSKSPDASGAVLVLLVYLALTAVALAIDRRALLVSALVYVLWALNGLFAAGQVAAGFGFTALILGSFLVMLSAEWGALRRRLLPALPMSLTDRLPLAA